MLDNNPWLKSLCERNRDLKDQFEKDMKKPKVKDENEPYLNPSFEKYLLETTDAQDMIEIKLTKLIKKLELSNKLEDHPRDVLL